MHKEETTGHVKPESLTARVKLLLETYVKVQATPTTSSNVYSKGSLKSKTTLMNLLLRQRGLYCPNFEWCFLSTLLSTTFNELISVDKTWTVTVSPLLTNGFSSSRVHSEVQLNPSSKTADKRTTSG